MDWLVRTKLLPPLPGNQIIARPRLHAAVENALFSRAVTLICAPAGYGKTTLASQWARTGRCAWLSLDEYDDEPDRFFQSILAALQRLAPACGANLAGGLPETLDRQSWVRLFVGNLVNAVLEVLPDPFVLALDDLHQVTQPLIYQGLDYLLQHRPPQMHLLITTRQEPPLALARLRAQGQLMELRLGNLRFTQAEADAFLNHAMQLNLDASDLAAMYGRSEGWPAGLRLLADALAETVQEAARAAWFDELRRADRLVFDYLAEEVLNRQPPDLRTFLLETSILAELTPGRCQAVTGRLEAGRWLEELFRRNLFLVQVGDIDPASPAVVPQAAYRYHALFAKFLRQRLESEAPGRVKELHARAAQAETVPERAIAHYLAAGLWQPAAIWIDEHGPDLLVSGRLSLLQRWIETIPQPERSAYPRLDWLLGVCSVQQGDHQAALPSLESAAQDFETAGDERGRGDALALLVSTAFLEGDLKRAAELIPQGLAHPLSPHAHIQLLMARSWIALLDGRFTPAAYDLDVALAVAESARAAEAYMVLSFYLKPMHAVLPDGIEKIERFCRQAAAYLDDRPSPLRMALGELETFLHLWRGRLPEARQQGERTLRMLADQGGYVFLGADTAMYVAFALAGQRQVDAAQAVLQRAIDRAADLPLEQMGLPTFLYLQALFAWQAGCLFDGPARLARMEKLPADIFPDHAVLRLLLSGLVALVERRYQPAEQALRQAVALQKREPVSRLTANAPVLLAYLLLETGRPAEALAAFSPLLAECQRNDCAGEIVKEGRTVIPLLRLAVARGVQAPYAGHLLSLLGETAGPEPISLPENGSVLTGREVEVLRLLAAGCSNRAIGERLVISQPTVKTHIAHLMQKLGVTSRTQVVARARELRLV